MNPRTGAALLTLACFPLTALAQYPHYNAVLITPVPSIPEQVPLVSFTLTNSMLACGYQYVTVPDGAGSITVPRAFKWSVPTASVNVGLPAGFGASSSVQGKWINNTGAELVSVRQTSPTAIDANFLYSSNGPAWTQITTPTGSTAAAFTVQFITDAGEIIGYYVGAGTFVPHRWPSATSASVPLPTPAPSFNGRKGTPVAVNQTGQVLMYYQPTAGASRAYVVGPDNSVQRILQSPAHVPLTETASGINDRGVVVGWSGNTNFTPDEQRAVRWDANGAPTDLFDQVGLFQNARAINNAGWIVGNGYASRSGDNYVGSVGKIYLPNLGTTNLTPLVNPGQLPDGASVQVAYNVNDSGQILVGVTGGATNLPYYILTPDNNCPIVSQHPPAAVNQCGAGVFTLTAGGYAATPVSYLWRRNSQPLLNQTSPVLSISAVSSEDNGLYDCVISNTCGNAVTTPCAVNITFACGVADIGAQGGVYTSCGDGVLDNNDFIVFIDLFFAASPIADRGVQGGVPGSDSAWNNNDFVVFVDQFFAGC
jgi:hypothetical protein